VVSGKKTIHEDGPMSPDVIATLVLIQEKPRTARQLSEARMESREAVSVRLSWMTACGLLESHWLPRGERQVGRAEKIYAIPGKPLVSTVRMVKRA
jgi:hypothetical protein